MTTTDDLMHFKSTERMKSTFEEAIETLVEFVAPLEARIVHDRLTPGEELGLRLLRQTIDKRIQALRSQVEVVQAMQDTGTLDVVEDTGDL